jgi:hypothetical protein
VPRGQFRKLPPGGFGHHAAGNRWPAVGATGLGQVGVGNAHLATGVELAAASQEAWPEAGRERSDAPRKSRGGTPTGERAPLSTLPRP